jgi:hypothetical protein
MLKEGEAGQDKEKSAEYKDYPLYQALTLLKGISIVNK